MHLKNFYVYVILILSFVLEGLSTNQNRPYHYTLNHCYVSLAKLVIIYNEYNDKFSFSDGIDWEAINTPKSLALIYITTAFGVLFGIQAINNIIT